MKTLIVMTVLTLLAVGCSSGVHPTGETFAIDGYVHAGPTCPTMQEPPDPNCADRPVVDAILVVRDAQNREVVRIRTDAEGRFRVDLPAGTYTLVPQPVEGLMGTAKEQAFTVPGTDALDVAYDTGIR